MSRILPFGQPLGAIMQTAYVVDDLENAARRWAKTLGVGPWLILDHFEADDMKYRGAPTDLDISIALAYSGSMCFELIFQHNDVPSVYRDVADGQGFDSFHHWAISTETFDEDVKRYEADGYEVAFEGAVAAVNGKRFAYADTRKSNGGMIELIEISPDVEALFIGVRDMSIDWDGTDIIRRPEA